MSTTTDGGKTTNHYQLLRLKPFEADQSVIRKNFHQLATQLRAKISAEPSVAKWTAMLNEMTRAMLVLADTRRKADYDASLGSKTAQAGRPPSLEKILRARKVLDDFALDRAVKFADTVNIELHDAVVQQKLATADVVLPLYADSLGMPFVDLADVTIDEALIPTVPAVMARQNSLTPVLVDAGQVVVASPNPIRPEIEEQLRLRFAMPVRQVICTKAAVDAAIERYYSREAAAAQMTTVPKTSGGGKSSGRSETNAGAPTPALNRAELRKKKLKIGFVAAAMTTMAVIFSCALFTDLLMTNVVLMYVAGLGAGAAAFGIGYLAVS